MGYTYGMKNFGSDAADTDSVPSLLTGAGKDDEQARRADSE